MENILDIKDICFGCGACANACPNDAIKMISNFEGFLEPCVDKNKCINCNICRNVCPQINESVFNTVQDAYAVICKDEIRFHCSSGGVFGAIARWVISEGGVVFGVAYIINFRRVEYKKATTISELTGLYKSKYLQSDTGTVYFEIKKALAESSNPVLFCGCPCQTDALKKYLKREYDNLIIIDIMCHGVVSPVAYGKFLDEIFADVDSPIVNVDFRPKENGWNKSITITAKDGTKRISPYNGSYFNAFLWGYSQRKVCFQCKYAQPKRVSDMTIGDFWGIDELIPEMNDKKGTSLVLCNTEKGDELLKKVSGFIHKIEKFNYKEVLKIAEKINWAIVKPSIIPPSRDVFFYRLSKGDAFTQAFKYASTGTFDVGIFGWWFEDDWTNYGSTLTYYSLMEYVSSLGLTVCMITSPFHSKDNASKFVSEHGYRMTQTYSFENFSEHNKNINTFLIGSDQLWFYHCYKNWGHSLFLDFADDEKKKIAYAPSFAHDDPEIPDKEIPKLKKLLDRFDKISVRENKGVSILRDKFGINSVQNVDPVFLCSIKIWEDIADEAERMTQGKYLFAYILDPSEDKINAIQYISDQLKLPIVSITDKQYETKKKEDLLKDCGILKKASLSEWIYHIAHASFVITDSYHGTCFSLIFSKSFTTMINRNRGKSRFDTLDELFGIGSRFVTASTDVIGNKSLLGRVDYPMIIPRINRAVKCSQAWLSNALLNS